MKRIILIFLGLFSLAYGQFSNTGAKTRFVNGISLGTKLDAYYNSADSNAIYWRADSVLRAKYKGTARTIAFVGGEDFIRNQIGSNLSAQTAKFRITDTMWTNGLIIGNSARVSSRYTTLGDIAFLQSTNTLAIQPTTLTTDRLIEFPDASGTIALTSDISSKISDSLGNLVRLKAGTSAGIGVYANNWTHVAQFGAGGGSGTTLYGGLNGTTINASGAITGGSIVRSGGTSSQFLKADGSVDGSTYLTQTTGDARYLQLTGGTLTGTLNGTNGVFSGNVESDFSISDYVSITQGVTAYGGLSRSGTWEGNSDANLGLFATTGRSLKFYTNGSGTAGMTLSTTNQLTLAGALSGTSATFSAGLTATSGNVTSSGTEPYLIARGTTNNALRGTKIFGQSDGLTEFAFSMANFTTGEFRHSVGFPTYGGFHSWYTNGVEGMRLNTGNRLLVNTTTDDGSSIIQANGNVKVDGNIALRYNDVLYWNSNTNQYIQADANNLYLGTANAARLTISTTGAATFSSSVSNNYMLSALNTNTTAGTSFGLFVRGGTNASDFALNVNNAANTVTLFQVKGDGAATFSSTVAATSFTALSRTVLGGGYVADNAASGNNIGIGFTSGGIISTNGSGSSTSQNLGTSSFRWATIFATTGDYSSTVTASGFIVSSDRRYKDIISQDGDVYSYTLKNDPSKTIRYGYLSQDVEKWMPNAVSKNSEGYGAVNYIDVLVYKVRQLEKQIEQLKNDKK